MNNKLKIGVIGAGKIAHLTYLPVLSRSDKCIIEALVTNTKRSREDAQEIFPIKNIYSSVSEMISACKIDCAIVLSKNEVHADNAIKLLSNNIDVLCEKPMAMSLNDCEKMVETARKYNRIFMVAFNRRYSPIYLKAREIIADLDLKVFSVMKNKDKCQEYAMWCDAIHVVDVLRWFAEGEVVDVQANGCKISHNTENTISSIVNFDNGKQGMFLMSRTSGEWEEKLEGYGDQTAIKVFYPNILEYTNEKKNEQVYINLTKESWGTITPRESWGFEKLIEHFFCCVQEKEVPLTNGEEALSTHKLVNQIYISSGFNAL